VRVDLVMGDARLTMERQQLAEGERYGILVIDAFSSDSVPVHLITREALSLYLDRIRPDGLILFHVSQRYLDLAAVLANLAAETGLTGYFLNDPSNWRVGKAPSQWVVLARNPRQLERLTGPPPLPGNREANAPPVLAAPPWRPLKPDPKRGVWTDDYSNLLGVFRVP
jgi:hypothetical protein